MGREGALKSSDGRPKAGPRALGCRMLRKDVRGAFEAAAKTGLISVSLTYIRAT